MSDFNQLLSFGGVADALNIDLPNVRILVVEERTLPAVHVTLGGFQEPYSSPFRLITVDDSGQTFDLSIGFDGRVHTGYLRVKRVALDSFVAARSLQNPKDPPTEKRWTPEALAELRAFRDLHGTKRSAEKFGISAQRIRQLLPSEALVPSPFSVLVRRK